MAAALNRSTGSLPILLFNKNWPWILQPYREYILSSNFFKKGRGVLAPAARSQAPAPSHRPPAGRCWLAAAPKKAVASPLCRHLGHRPSVAHPAQKVVGATDICRAWTRVQAASDAQLLLLQRAPLGAAPCDAVGAGDARPAQHGRRYQHQRREVGVDLCWRRDQPPVRWRQWRWQQPAGVVACGSAATAAHLSDSRGCQQGAPDSQAPANAGGGAGGGGGA
jgi:hypothetical protein